MSRASQLEFHLFARFQRGAIGVRIAVFFSERATRSLGNKISQYADEVWYRIKPRDAATKPYRRPKPRPATPWRGFL